MRGTDARADGAAYAGRRHSTGASIVGSIEVPFGGPPSSSPVAGAARRDEIGAEITSVTAHREGQCSHLGQQWLASFAVATTVALSVGRRKDEGGTVAWP